MSDFLWTVGLAVGGAIVGSMFFHAWTVSRRNRRLRQIARKHEIHTTKES